jgi:hypothetical protein
MGPCDAYLFLKMNNLSMASSLATLQFAQKSVADTNKNQPTDSICQHTEL